MEIKREKISFGVKGLTIRGELFTPELPEKPSLPALILCHGIPRGFSELQDPGYPGLAERICPAGFMVMFFNFRGTGESEGNFDILGWAEDLKAAVDYLWQHPWINRKRLSVMGFSGGAAVAIYVTAHDQRISSLISCASPASFDLLGKDGVAADFLSEFRRIGIIRDREFPPSLAQWKRNFQEIAPRKWVASISPRPILIIHGSRDSVIDVGDAHLLYQLAREPKEIRIIEGAEHRLRIDNRVIEHALKWLTERLSKSPS
jgi:fermentation-respiration switch protein FrsA (DUF1100 family)